MYKGCRSSAWAKRRSNKGVRRLGRYDVETEVLEHEDGANEDETGYNRTMSKNTVLGKLQAIEYLLRNGYRGSEWQEAGLLEAVSEVVFNRNNGVTEAELDRLILMARDN